MKKEIEIRKKRVVVWLLIGALLWNGISPTAVQAVDYTMNESGSTIYMDDQVNQNDTIACAYSGVSTGNKISVTYYDACLDTSEMYEELYTCTEEKAVETESETVTGAVHTVLSYSEVLEYKETEYISVLNSETFGGWKVSYVFASGGEATINLTAIPRTYNISYELNGGSLEVENPKTYTYGTGITEFTETTGFTVPTREGYTFDGWYSDAACETVVTNISNTQTGDITLYAKWTEIVTEPDTPSESEPEESVPSESEPEESVPSETVPEESVPSETVPEESVPSETVPEESVPSESEPEESVPEESVPSETAPEESTPSESVPSETVVVIESSGTLSLQAGTAYTLGSGSWKITGDTTVYAGGITFYVDKDAKYEFVKQ